MTKPFTPQCLLLIALNVIITSCIFANDAPPSGNRSAFQARIGWTTSSRLLTPHATQAAAADTKYLYAISSTTVAQFDRHTGRLVNTATSPTTKHLNSGFLEDGKLYCAHSNYPHTPHESDIRVFTPGGDSLEVYHTFPSPPGSLVWCVKRNGIWWFCFAHYGTDNHLTCLVEYAAGGLQRERRRLFFPTEVVADFDSMSASGGLWDGDSLLASHHHFPVLYRLTLPGPAEPPERLQLAEVLRCPFPGQGFAIDLQFTAAGQRPHLVGIDRPGRAVVLAEPLKESLPGKPTK